MTLQAKNNQFSPSLLHHPEDSGLGNTIPSSSNGSSSTELEVQDGDNNETRPKIHNASKVSVRIVRSDKGGYNKPKRRSRETVKSHFLSAYKWTKDRMEHTNSLSIGEHFEFIIDSIGLKAPFEVLHRIWCIFRPHHKRIEQPQVIIANSLWLIVTSLFIHAIPIAATFVIYDFKRKGEYIGSQLPGTSGYTAKKEFGLQLAAKLHELTILASLNSIVFSLVRYLLFTEKGVPFAALSAGFKWTSISYLWSTELWAIPLSIHSQVRHIKRGKVMRLLLCLLLFLLLVVCTLLGVTVGPASAVAMHPHFDVWEGGGVHMKLNSSIARLFPLELNESHVPGQHCAVAGSEGCPSESWEVYKTFFNMAKRRDVSHGNVRKYQTLLPMGIPIPLGQTLITPYLHLGGPDGEGNLWTSATMSHSVIANALRLNMNLWEKAVEESQRYDGTHYVDNNGFGMDIRMFQPLTRVICNNTAYDGHKSSSTGPYFPSFVRRGNSTRKGNLTSYPLYQQWIQDDFSNDQPTASLHWISGEPSLSGLDKEIYGNMEAAALVTLPYKGRPGGNLVACTAMAKYIKGERAYVDNYGTIDTDWAIVSSIRDFAEDGTGKDRYAKISPSWADYVNPNITELNSTVFEQVALAAGVWDPNNGSTDAPVSRIEGILTMMLVVGMANTDSSAVVQGHIKDYYNMTVTGPWWREFMPQPQPGKAPGGGGSPWNLTQEENDQYLGTYMRVTIKGYANRLNSSTSTQFALSILFVYVGLALLYIVSTKMIRTSRAQSKAWESVTEAIALAFASESPGGVLQNISGGIRTIQVLERPVRVSVKNSRIQLVDIEQETWPYKGVKTNTRY